MLPILVDDKINQVLRFSLRYCSVSPCEHYVTCVDRTDSMQFMFQLARNSTFPSQKPNCLRCYSFSELLYQDRLVVLNFHELKPTMVAVPLPDCHYENMVDYIVESDSDSEEEEELKEVRNGLIWHCNYPFVLSRSLTVPPFLG